MNFKTCRILARQMICALPDEGGTIVVITQERGRCLNSGIVELRGDAVARRWKMVSVCTRPAAAKLDGLIGNVFLDASVAHLPDDLQIAIAEKVNAIQIMKFCEGGDPG